MKAMQAQMDKIRNTTEPTERQKLMQEHMQAMQENMKAMRGMGGKKGDMKDGDMMKRHQMMEKTHRHGGDDDGADDAARSDDAAHARQITANFDSAFD